MENGAGWGWGGKGEEKEGLRTTHWSLNSHWFRGPSLINTCQAYNKRKMAGVVEACLECFPNVNSLKPEQRDAVEALLDGQDVLAVLPTGFGKSLIYQLYVQAKHRSSSDRSTSILVVSSPLRSIVEEQIKDGRNRYYCRRTEARRKMLERRCGRKISNCIYLGGELFVQKLPTVDKIKWESEYCHGRCR